MCLATANLLGCAHRFTGDFLFKNSSTNELLVHASGWRGNPPVMPPWMILDGDHLAPGAYQDLGFNPMRLPETVTIAWNVMETNWTKVTDHGTTNVSLSTLPTYPGAGVIVLEFTPQHFWTLKYERNIHQFFINNDSRHNPN
jgi:hypothetical protein